MGDNRQQSEGDELAEKIKRDKLRKQRQEEEEQEEQERANRRTSRAQTEEAGDNPENARQEEEERKQREQEKKEEEQRRKEQEEQENQDQQEDENGQEEREQQQDKNEEQNSDDKNKNKEEQVKKDKEDKSDDSEKKSDKESDKKSEDNSNKKEEGKGNNKTSNDGKTPNNNPSSNNQKLNLNKPGGQTPRANMVGNAAKQTGKQASKEASKKAAEQAAKQAGKAAVKAGSKLALGPILFWVILIVLIIIFIVGILFFFITMPGIVVGKIGDAINGFRTAVGDYVDSTNKAEKVVKEEVVKAAKYVENMGYDLQGYGFLSHNDNEQEKGSKVSGKAETAWYDDLSSWWDENESVIENEENDETDNLQISEFTNEDAKKRVKNENDEDKEKIQEVYLSKTFDNIENVDEDEVKKSIVMIKSTDGEVLYAKSKYLAMYIAAENAIYLVRNDNTNVFQRFAKIWGGNDENEGSGMITFVKPDNVYVSDYVENYKEVEFAEPEGILGINKYEVDRETQTLIIDNAGDGLFKSSSYTYDLNKSVVKYRNPNSTFSSITFIKFSSGFCICYC